MTETIEAGRETDARIAVEIFGWVWRRCPANDVARLYDPRSVGAVECEPVGPGDPKASHCPVFTHSSHEAMRLLEQITERTPGRLVELDVLHDTCSARVLLDGEWVERSADGRPLDALPLAICRAALAPEVLAYLGQQGAEKP